MKRLVLIVILGAFSACTKEPSANFTLSTEECTVGDIVRCQNSSLEGYTYTWTLPDGSQEKAENLDYTPLDAGIHKITLTAYSKNKKKDDEISKTINVIEAKGNAVFFTNADAGCGTITVTINPGNLTGEINSFHTAEPNCSDNSALIANLAVGQYSYIAEDNCGSWNNNFIITKNGCTKIGLQQ